MSLFGVGIRLFGGVLNDHVGGSYLKKTPFWSLSATKPLVREFEVRSFSLDTGRVFATWQTCDSQAACSPALYARV